MSSWSSCTEEESLGRRFGHRRWGMVFNHRNGKLWHLRSIAITLPVIRFVTRAGAHASAAVAETCALLSEGHGWYSAQSPPEALDS